MDMEHELGGDIPHDGAEHYFPDPVDDLTGGLPVNLDSLRDGPPGTKPFYPYSTLIRYAIKGSPNQKLLLEDIYYAIESRFPYFRTASSGWKNSVRHNLSLNPCFEKVPRPLTDRGKGSYWTVNESVDPRTGVHRVRAPKQPTPAEGTENGEGQPSGSGGTKRRGRKAKGKAASTSPEEFNPDRPFIEGAPSFVPPPLSASMVAGPSNDPNGFPGFHPGAFDQPPPPPPFMFMPPVPPVPDLPVDESGNVDWHAAWVRELDSLRAATGEAEKHGAGQDWYREMLLKVRTGMLMQIVPPAGPPPPEVQQDITQPPE
ncbi:unnamed protein product [Peniophora sp. CBMAI 1063]|nr:unnamed protein product [Peniophora sp. CBMAI 1063]